MLQYLYPSFTAVFAGVALGERISPRVGGALALGLAGVAVMARPWGSELGLEPLPLGIAILGAVLTAAGMDPERVSPIATADLQPARPAPRPANSVLDNAAARAAGLSPLRDFRETLAEVVDQLTGD